MSRFRWTAFDVTDLLPAGWQKDAMAAAQEAEVRDFPRTPILTREAAHVQSIKRGRVHARQVKTRLPWLYKLYHGAFRELAEQAWREPISTAHDERYGLVLNVQRGKKMRFECHVDSNPVTGLLFLTSHRQGGELVIARDVSAKSVQDVDRDCSVIRPQAGHLVFFDVRQHPHYSRELRFRWATRVVADMNFYTKSFPESTRPPELNIHLYGNPK